jgi:predicted homoserine dehydrogenase-like protein
MHGPSGSLEELTHLFAHVDNGGILSREGVVDYVVGDIAPGVFVVFATEDAALAKDLDYIGMGKGPGYLLYRPYHLVSMEIPISIARAAIYGEPTIVSKCEPVAETITVAKRDLKPGTALGAIGDRQVYGLIETAATARAEGLLPLGLAEGAIVTSHVPEGSSIRWDQVEIQQPDMLLHLRMLQDAMYA